MFSIDNIQFTIDHDNHLECECMAWLDKCRRDPAPHDEIKDALVVGYAIMKHGFGKILDSREAKRMRLENNCVVDQVRLDMQRAMEHQLSLMRLDKEAEIKKHQTDYDILLKQFQYLQQTMETKLEDAKSHAEYEKSRDIGMLQEKVSDLVSIQNELRSQLVCKDAEIKQLNERMISKLEGEETKRLMETIREKEIVIAQLKNTNNCKGIYGETVVRDILMRAFTDHAILDMSGCPNESDIHLVNHRDEIIAIECKYKETVTNDDVKKSMRDIGYLKTKYGDKFKAYVFYSLKNFNIPKKGTCFEVVNNIPVIWHGTHMEHDPHFENQIVMMVKIAQGLASMMKTGQRDVDQLVTMLNAMVTELEKNKACIVSLHNNTNANMNIIKSLTDSNNAQLTAITQFMRDHNIATHVQESNQPLDCPHCGRNNFKRPCDLKRHMSKCEQSNSE